MRSILSLGLTAIAASTVSADTTIAVLEFGPGGSVHRTTSSADSSSAAVASFWNALHRPSSKKSTGVHAGMSVVPDLFTSADAGIVVGIKGGESLKSMPTAMSLLDEEAKDNVVGHMYVPGQAGAELMKRASKKDVESIAKEDMVRRLQKTAESAARGAVEGMETLSLVVDNDETATIADEQLGRMLETLKKEASSNGKTVIVHLVVEEEGRRRLNEDEDNKDGEQQNQNQNNNNQNNNQNQNYGEKTMYEIQTFNLFLWTAVGLFVILSMVIGAFINMPLMPDTLLFGEAAKLGGSD